MLGTYVRGDVANAEVSLFIGKNPWQSHSIPHARSTLKEIARDPQRSMIVIDPRRSETAELADFHLQVRPGRDAWLVAAMAAIVVQEDLIDHAFVAEHTLGAAEVLDTLGAIPVTRYCGIAGSPRTWSAGRCGASPPRRASRWPRTWACR
ncbi:MAG: molybdopterin-dependent oxidoreductase [Microthrixaceae bacterium]|nr:molybdopterin-dependent oxidoreductase [Microthrixaceae bacterium]